MHENTLLLLSTFLCIQTVIEMLSPEQYMPTDPEELEKWNKSEERFQGFYWTLDAPEIMEMVRSHFKVSTFYVGEIVSKINNPKSEVHVYNVSCILMFLVFCFQS